VSWSAGQHVIRAAAQKDFERTVLNTYCAVDRGDRSRTEAERSLPLLRGREAEVRAILTRHKALIFFEHSMSVLTDHVGKEALRAIQSTVTALADEITRWRLHQEMLCRELEWLRQSPMPSGHGVVVIKGVNNSRFYPDPTVRWSRDIDLFIPTWSDSVLVVDLLRKRGYVPDHQECAWVKADSRNGRREYGQFFLVRQHDNGYLRLDLHFGTYSIGYADYLRRPLTDFSDVRDHKTGRLGAVNATGSLLLLLAHSLSDGYVSIRDANDAVAMCRSSAQVEWTVLGEEIHRHSLGPQTRLLASHLLRQYRDDEAVTEYAHRLASAARSMLPSIWAMHNRNWQRRALVNALHSFRSTLRRGGSIWRAVERAIRCYAYYSRRLHIRVGRRSLLAWLLLGLMAKSDLTRWNLRADACPLLVHANHTAVAEAAVGRSDPQDGRRSPPYTLSKPMDGVELVCRRGVCIAVRIGRDVFLLSWDQIISDEQAEYAVALRTREPGPTPG
jgi:hypothetical protein